MIDYDKLRRNKNERNQPSGFVFSEDIASGTKGYSDRSSIRVFEEAMACQSDGNWLSGTRNAQEEFAQFIIEIAKSNNLFIQFEDCKSFGELVPIRSGESKIYENKAEGTIYKVRDPFAKFHLKSNNVVDVLYEHIIHNLLFPNTRYTLIGISEFMDSLRLIYSQKLFFNIDLPTQQQIDAHLISMGLIPEEKYYYGNEYLAVTDVYAEGDNVLVDLNGNLLFIDPIIKLKKPVSEVISYLEKRTQ